MRTDGEVSIAIAVAPTARRAWDANCRRVAGAPKAAFSLIEMIGVLAMMAILASVIAPSAMKMMDLAAVRAEEETLKNLAREVVRYVRDTGDVPTGADWVTKLQSYSELNAGELTNNKRQRARVFLFDATTQRAMFLSVMSPNATLGVPTTVSSQNFQRIWDTADNQIPTTQSWAGWSAWNAVPNSHQHLVIQRIHLGKELQTFPIVLVHSGSVGARYEVIPSSAGIVSLPVGAIPVPLTLRAGQRVNLYASPMATTPAYTYVVSDSGKTLEFTSDNRWTAK